MITNPTPGMRVKFYRPEIVGTETGTLLNHKTGTIIRIVGAGLVRVLLDEPIIYVGREIYCNTGFLYSISDNIGKEDQETYDRTIHAMKFL